MLQDVINPANVSEVVGQVRACTAADVDELLEQARSVFKTWSRTAPEDRALRLSEAAHDLRNALPQLAPLFVRENGKPLREAEVDITYLVQMGRGVVAHLVGYAAIHRCEVASGATARIGHTDIDGMLLVTVGSTLSTVVGIVRCAKSTG